jgi:hypothetical protein
LRCFGPLIFARAAADDPSAAQPASSPRLPWEAFGALVPRSVSDFEVAADWKLLVEQWLESPPQPPQHFVAPNLFVELRADAALIVQVTALAPGRSRLRRFDFAAHRARAAGGAQGRTPRGAWQRRVAAWLDAQIELAESTQTGLLTAAEESVESGPVAPALAQFRAPIAALLHALPAA